MSDSTDKNEGKKYVDRQPKTGAQKPLTRRTLIKGMALGTVGSAVVAGGSGLFLGKGARHAARAANRTSVGLWQEYILNDDGSINWDAYTWVAQHFDQDYVRDYWFGPKYGDVHPSEGNIPTVFHVTNGEITSFPGGGVYAWGSPSAIANYAQNSTWWASAGQLLYTPDFYDDPGINLARKTTDLPDKNLNNQSFAYVHLNLSWEPSSVGSGHGSEEWWVRAPDYSVDKQWVLNANGGQRPLRPVGLAYARIGGKQMNGVAIYQNGLITTVHNDAQLGSYGAAFKLPANKVPTAVALTDGHEFALVTVWDTDAQKGQVAFIAMQGPIMGEPTNADIVWGLPNWFHFNDMKLLGFVDLPFAAPSSISIGMDHIPPIDPRGSQSNGRLSSQSERDKWNKGVDLSHLAADAGYVIVASRAENQVAFIDMQPLYQFYRQMYFTTQDNYNATQNVGHNDDQWPYTFNYSSGQTPIVAAVLNVTTPTAVQGGYMDAYGSSGWIGDTRWFRQHAYVATMDGTLQCYDVTSLISVGPKTTPALVSTTAIGNNPTYIEFSALAYDANTLKITCRGDRSILFVAPDGTILKTLQDTRIVDPVMAHGGKDLLTRGILTVVDFNGKQVHSYLYDGVRKLWISGSFWYSITHDFEHTHTRSVPGKPFIYLAGEVY